MAELGTQKVARLSMLLPARFFAFFGPPVRFLFPPRRSLDMALGEAGGAPPEAAARLGWPVWAQWREQREHQ